jgi:hypothetical protein
VVHVTRDGGRNWQKVTPAELPEFTRISLIDASPHDPAVAYLAGNRYQRSDRAPYVYKTSDYGRTWTTIVKGLPGDDFPRAIREDPKRKGLLFLGTETSIYVSFDDGGVWQSLRLDLPVTPVHGVQIKNDDLVIGTHGRSFYVLDDIGVLRQVTRNTTDEAVVLFDPSDATRSVSRGVTIDYYLRQPADKVTIDILDAEGQAINSFTGPSEASGRAGGRGADAPDPAEEGGGGRGAPPPRVTARQGMNRFTWDMRYPNAREFPGIILWAGNLRGPQAPPGKYQVRLTAAGVTKTHDVQILRNPAFATVTDADLQAQFTLARQISQKVSQANSAVIRIRSLKAQAADRAAKSPEEAVKKAAATWAARLTDIEGEIYQHRNQSSQDPLNYPIRLNNKLAALQGTVEGGDARPTDQAHAVFKELSGRLDKQLARLDGFLQSELPAFNKLLTDRKLDPIKDDVAGGTR